MFLVGVMGFVPALGQINQSVDCSTYPVECFMPCVDLKLCHADGPTGERELTGCSSEQLSLNVCLSSSPARGGYPPWVVQVPPQKTVVTYHAGKCDGTEFMRWVPFYYDDDTIESYKLTTTGSTAKKSSISSTGFYPKKKKDAVDAYIAYYYTGRADPFSVALPIYVSGYHATSSVSNCSLPKVTEARFNTIRSRAKSETWDEFHIAIKNSSHWAKHVRKTK